MGGVGCCALWAACPALSVCDDLPAPRLRHSCCCLLLLGGRVCEHILDPQRVRDVVELQGVVVALIARHVDAGRRGACSCCEVPVGGWPFRSLGGLRALARVARVDGGALLGQDLGNVAGAGVPDKNEACTALPCGVPLLLPERGHPVGVRGEPTFEGTYSGAGPRSVYEHAWRRARHRPGEGAFAGVALGCPTLSVDLAPEAVGELHQGNSGACDTGVAVWARVQEQVLKEGVRAGGLGSA